MEYDIIAKKKWVKGGEGAYPARVVLLKIKRCDDRDEYSTHIQYDASEDGLSKYVGHGHYFTNLLDAAKDFEEREV